jgi:hypothetical protein
VYLPDLPRPAYRDLLDELEQEFTYTFGGCTTLRGLDGSYLSHAGLPVRDRINVLYTDTPFALEENLTTISRYADQLRETALDALGEEAVLVVVARVFHSAE